MAEGELASAVVRISPDLSAFKDDLKAKLDAAMVGVDHRTLTIEADTEQARLSIAATQRELAGLGDGSIGITADPVAGFRDELRAKIEADLAGFVPDVTVKVDADTTEADAKLAATDVEAHALGDRRETITVNADTALADAKLAATSVGAAPAAGLRTDLERQLNAILAEVRLNALDVGVDPMTGVRDVLKARIDSALLGIDPRPVSIKVDADTTDADIRIAATDAAADLLGAKRETIQVGIDTSRADLSGLPGGSVGITAQPTSGLREELLAKVDAALAGIDLPALMVGVDPQSDFAERLKARIDAALLAIDPYVTVSVTADTARADAALGVTDGLAKALGSESPTIKPEVDTSAIDRAYAEIRARAAALAAERTRITVEAATAFADAQLAATGAEARALGEEHPTIKVDADTTGADAALAATAVEAAAVGGGMDAIKTGADTASSGLSGLTSAALALSPALIPIGAVGAAGLASLLTPITAATAGIGAFGLIALPTIKNVATAYTSLQTAQTAYNNAVAQGNVAGQTKALADMKGVLDNLAPGVRENVLAVQALWQEWQKVSNAMAPIVSDVLTAAIGDFKDLLGVLQPVAQATGGALVDAFHSLGTAMQQPDFKAFITFVTSQAGPSISFFVNLVENLMGFLSKLAEAFAPLASVVEAGLLRMTAAWEQWAGKLESSQGFQQFIQYVETNAPIVGQFISELLQLLGRIVVAAAPVGTVLLEVLTPLLGFVNAILKLSPIIGPVLISLAGLAVAYAKLSGPIGAAVTALEAFILKTGVMSAGGFIGGTSGLAGLVAGFGALASAAAVAIPVVAALGVVLDTINTARKEAATPQGVAQYLSGGPLDLGTALATKPIGPTQDLQAMKDITAQMNQVRTEQASLVREAGGMDTLFSSTGDVGAVTAFNNMTGAIQKYQDEINAARGARDQWISNESKLSGSLGISKASVDQLAASLNIDLSKALNPSEITRMQQALQLMATNAHITASAMDFLASETHQSVSSITNDMNAAATATQKAFASWSDPIAGVTQQMSLLATVSSSQQSAITTAQGLATAQTNLQQAQTAANTALAASGATSSQYVSAQQAVVSAQQAVTTAASAQSSAVTASANAQSAALGTIAQATVPTAAAISGFYNRMKTEGNAFTTNIQQAIKDGYDPTLINQILQAGPTAAGPLLQGLITNYSSSFKTLVNNGQAALKTIGDQAVEEARLMQVAVQAHTSAVTANYSAAVALSEQIAAQGGKATVTSLANALGLGLYQTAIIANEYGIQLPKAIGAAVPAVVTAVKAQTAPLTEQGAQWVKAALAAQAGVAGTTKAVTDAVPAHLAAGRALAEAAAHGIDAGQGTASTSGKNLGQKAHDGITSVDTKDAGQKIAQGTIDGVTQKQAELNAGILKAIKTAIESSAKLAGGQSIGVAIDNGIAQGMTTDSIVVANALSAMLSGLKTKALGYFTGANGWLTEAGKSIMFGLALGIQQGFASFVTPLLSGMATKIGNLKGPLDADRVLLVPHGEAIMDGLKVGLNDGFLRQVEPLLTGMARQISSQWTPALLHGFTTAPNVQAAKVESLIQPATAGTGPGANAVGGLSITGGPVVVHLTIGDGHDKGAIKTMVEQTATKVVEQGNAELLQLIHANR